MYEKTVSWNNVKIIDLNIASQDYRAIYKMCLLVYGIIFTKATFENVNLLTSIKVMILFIVF